jgi:alkaline phosphatase
MFQNQHFSIQNLTGLMSSLKEKKSGDTEEDFATLMQLLNVQLGLGVEEYGTALTAEEQQVLKEAMVKSIYPKAGDKTNSTENETITETALKILADKAGISWGTSGHTFMAVPVYAIGAGSEEFGGFMDNTDIPKKMEKLMGIQ